MRAVHEANRWIVRRKWPATATGMLVAIGMASTTWWGPHLTSSTQWQLPDDLWGTLLAASRLARLDIAGIYSSPTGLIALPGAAVILVPVAVLLNAFGLSLAVPGPTDPHPTSWLLAGPYEIVVSSIVLFAADAVAERCGASQPKRLVLAAAEAVALWSVSVRWGHPEDAVAIGLLLYAALALDEGRSRRCALLVGAAICVQPLVLLAVPLLFVILEPFEVRSFTLRAAAVPAIALGAALATNWNSTVQAVGNQPNWPTVDHETPWTVLAPHMTHGAVSASPARGVAIVLACVCALIAERRWRTRRSKPSLEELLWWMAVVLALRSAFEPVMVAYYVWPMIAVALCTVTTSWRWLLTGSVVGSALTFTTQIPWNGPWGWWAMTLGEIVFMLGCTRAGIRARGAKQPAPAQGSHETWPFKTTYPTNAPVSIKA